MQILDVDVELHHLMSGRGHSARKGEEAFEMLRIRGVCKSEVHGCVPGIKSRWQSKGFCLEVCVLVAKFQDRIWSTVGRIPGGTLLVS